jgi:hypothetical protein
VYSLQALTEAILVTRRLVRHDSRIQG